MEINIKTYHHFPEFVHKLHLIKSNSPLPAGNISPSTIRCLLLEILCLFTILPQRNVFSVRTQISMPHPYYSRILGTSKRLHPCFVGAYIICIYQVNKYRGVTHKCTPGADYRTPVNFLPPFVWGQSYNRGGQTFVTFIHHDLVSVLFWHCIFLKKVSPNKHMGIK